MAEIGTELLAEMGVINGPANDDPNIPPLDNANSNQNQEPPQKTSGDDPPSGKEEGDSDQASDDSTQTEEGGEDSTETPQKKTVRVGFEDVEVPQGAEEFADTLAKKFRKVQGSVDKSAAEVERARREAAEARAEAEYIKRMAAQHGQPQNGGQQQAGQPEKPKYSPEATSALRQYQAARAELGKKEFLEPAEVQKLLDTQAAAVYALSEDKIKETEQRILQSVEGRFRAVEPIYTQAHQEQGRQLVGAAADVLNERIKSGEVEGFASPIPKEHLQAKYDEYFDIYSNGGNIPLDQMFEFQNAVWLKAVQFFQKNSSQIGNGHANGNGAQKSSPSQANGQRSQTATPPRAGNSRPQASKAVAGGSKGTRATGETLPEDYAEIRKGLKIKESGVTSLLLS